MRKTCTIVSLLFMVGCLFLAPVAHATDPWQFSKDETFFGHLDQHLVPGFPLVACAPTAAVNSFDYLQSYYAPYYGTSLVPDLDGDGTVGHDTGDLSLLAWNLGTNYMNTTNLGTLWGDFVLGKYDYLEWVAPGKTVYQAQDAFDWVVTGDNHAGETRPWWDKPMNPTPEFIYEQLIDCEDVELFLMKESGGHAVTLTSWTWDSDMMWTRGLVTGLGLGMMDYIDPWTGAHGECDIWMDEGRLQTGYWRDPISGELTASSWIKGAVSESVPEPITLVMLGSLGAGMFVARKLRGKRAA